MGSPSKKMASGPFADKLWREAIRKVAFEVAEGRRGPKKLEMAARALVKAAMEGDVSAAKEIGDRLDGKPAQAVAVDGNLTVTLAQLIQQSQSE